MTSVIIVISIFLFVGYALLILYYRQSWRQIPRFRNDGPMPVTRISVIIPARNEEENIGNCLDSISNQSYPQHLFEVIVIDDHSTDRTAGIVSDYPAENVHLLSLKDFVADGAINAYKKKAIEIAIQRSNGELIVTTDADCTVPSGWLETIASFYKKNDAAFIAMPVGYHYKTNFLEIFQSMDFMTLQGITGASVYKKAHSMCNGANLAYQKKAFIAVGGFKGVDNIASGDDMLLMHKIFKVFPEKVLFLKSEAVIVYTQPMDSLKGFFNQRIRWASKADKYDDKRIFAVLLLVYFFNAWFLLLAIGAFFFHTLYYLVILLIAKTLVELFFLFPVARFFKQQTLLWWFPLAQPFHIVYTIIAGWLGKFGSYQWKERKLQ